jgi:hypothetical protein
MRTQLMIRGEPEWPQWIRSPQSKKYLREEVRKGDIVVCYQSEGRRICGFTRMAGNGRDEPKGSGDFNMLYLAGNKKALCIEASETDGNRQKRKSGTRL